MNNNPKYVTNMKNIFITIIALLLPSIASAEKAEVGGLYYYLNESDNTAMVTCQYDYDYFGDDKCYSPYTGAITIPPSITYGSVPYTVTGIGYNAFRDCSGLTSVTIPNTVTSIGENAFMHCIKLNSVTIPNSVMSIGENAFYDTKWFDNQPNGLVYAGNVLYKYKGTMPDKTDIIIPSGTVEISGRAFEGCSGLASITIPKSVKSIGNWTFENCSGLTSVTIPEGVESIGVCAFYGCSNLKSVIIPSSVTIIGHATFGECDNLLSVTSYITEPFIVWSFFSENTYRKGTLTVPANTKDLYVRFDGWKEFLKIVEMEGGIYNLSIQDSSNGTIDLKVKDGNTFKLKITPKGGKTIKNVYFNDDDVTKDLDSENNYTTPAITANSTLRIVYKGDKRGDLNDDDKVDVADHVELSKIILGEE